MSVQSRNWSVIIECRPYTTELRPSEENNIYENKNMKKVMQPWGLLHIMMKFSETYRKKWIYMLYLKFGNISKYIES